ncbi:MAG: deoxyguanosinetriphosphate triphosphohydrolase [Ruminococcaceae bacterium]|nr:deoxyguanosinetriphosphate triphosphohydrolase [Oscillospiraceae bacterium]
MTIAEMMNEREKQNLSPFACLSSKTKGREHYVEPCTLRTEFQRDRDRITHCKSFRRLMHKTQVFLCPEDDHYRTRLTHTLEVTQIARTIARALFLNEDLAEAVALGHDLGHTPFGHAGESVLQECFSPDFTHYKQSLRVVEKLENDGAGLNLTYEVRDGIVNHTGEHLASTLEGRICKFADRIAYINHDIDDAVRAKVLRYDDIPGELLDILGKDHSARINTMVTSVIESSTGKNEISMKNDIYEATMALRRFLNDNVYYNPVAKHEETRAKDLLRKLYEYFVTHPEEMPPEYLIDESESIERRVCDYISGMTDRYAINLFEELFVPKVWNVN